MGGEKLVRCMPRAALSCAYAGKRPSVRTEAPDEAKPRPSAQQISVSLIQSRGGLPLTSKVRSLTPRCQIQKQSEIFDSAVPNPKVLFCFCFVFLVSLLVAFGWPRQGGQSCQASSRRCRLAWSQKHRHRPARRRLRGEAAFSQFHPLVNTCLLYTSPSPRD